MLPRRLADAIWLYQQALWDYNQTYHVLRNDMSKKRVRRQLLKAQAHLLAVCVEVAQDERSAA